MARKKAESRTVKNNCLARHKVTPTLKRYGLSIALTVAMVVLRRSLAARRDDEKQAEASLRESEAKYRNVFESIDEMVTVYEIERDELGNVAEPRLTDANPAFLNVVGISSIEDACGKTSSEILGKHWSDCHLAAIQEAMDSGKARFQEVFRPESGRYYITSIVPLSANSFLATGRDISERRQAEEALRENEQRLRLAMRGAGGAAWDLDLATGVVWWSPEMYALFNIEPGTAIDVDKALAAIDEDDRERVRQVVEQAVAQRSDYQCEFRIPHATRGECWIAAHGALLCNAADAPTRLMGVCFDITKRKQTELELERLRNLLAEGQKIAHLGSWEFVAATHSTVWSEEQKRIYGLDPAEPSPVYEVMLQNHIHPDDAAELDRAFKEAFSHGSPFENENRIVRPDGSVRFIHNRAVPFFDEQGKLVRYVGATLDITERKQTEDVLKELNEELERKVAERTAELREKDQMLQVQSRQAAMGEMIGNISHQWRQPLNNLALAVQEVLFFFDRGKLDREFLEKNVESSMQLIEHMSNTIEDFRNYFKPDKEKADFRVNDVIAKTLALLEDTFKHRNVKVVVETQDDLVIHGYFNEFGQVLLNILNNAMDVFTERSINEPQVIITSGAENAKPVLTISDNAGGIPEEIIGKIFDPYFTTRGPQRGTGIGLYMAKSIIEKNMGGRLSARNTAIGAEFRIQL